MCFKDLERDYIGRLQNATILSHDEICFFNTENAVMAHEFSLADVIY